MLSPHHLLLLLFSAARMAYNVCVQHAAVELFTYIYIQSGNNQNNLMVILKMAHS